MLRVFASGDVKPVYDLLVAHDHEFYANDIIVSNCFSWLEELAAWRYLQACWEQLRFGLRVGPRPHWVASTTPKPRPLIKKLAKDTPENVVITRATTNDNPHLQPDVRRELEEDYGGTQLGRQELDAEILDEDKNALWTRDTLDRFRVGAAPDLARVVVGVDPSGGAGEQGIVVVGKGRVERRLSDSELLAGVHPHADPVAAVGFAAARERAETDWHGFVLADQTVCLPPAGWSRRAVRAAVEWQADELVVERNFGGDMAVSTLQDALDAEDVVLPVKTVTASRGKHVRAQPVSALSARGRWHMVGTFPELEDQLATWTPESDYSPDRLDAMVWCAWRLGLVSTRSRGRGSLPFAELVEAQLI